jgi:hypothetical protein
MLSHQMVAIVTRDLLENNVDWSSLSLLVDDNKYHCQRYDEQTKDTSNDTDVCE